MKMNYQALVRRALQARTQELEELQSMSIENVEAYGMNRYNANRTIKAEAIETLRKRIYMSTHTKLGVKV